MPPPASPSISLPSNSSNTNQNSNSKLNFLLNPSHSISPPIDPSIADRASSTLPSRPAATSRGISENAGESDFEVAFLLRHYSEVPGLWYFILFFFLADTMTDPLSGWICST
jgi:hypothetical protein